MHLDEFQQKVEECNYNTESLEVIQKHWRALESLQRMFPNSAGYYTGYISDEFIPGMLIFLAQLAEKHNLNLNTIATKAVKEDQNKEYRPE